MKSLPLFFAALFCSLALAGCGSSDKKQAAHARLVEESNKTAKADYKIGVGDEIEVKFFFTPELNDRVTVQPDGNISLMFADNVKAEGLTTKQLVKVLKKELAPHVKQLDLSVVIRNFASQRVYVGGEVAKPGPIAIVGKQTVLQTLGEAGWAAPSGNLNEVILMRRNKKGVEEVYNLKIADAMSGKDVSQNVTVMAGDTLLVPPYDAINLDRWMQRNVRDAMPFAPGLTINRNVGP